MKDRPRQTMFIYRGLPGSGKTTAANALKIPLVEADQFFSFLGTYRYRPDCIDLAHNWARHEAARWLMRGENVVVTGTFTRRWEIAEYAAVAYRCGADVVVRVCTGNWPNEHGVQEAKIEAMRARWEEWPGEEPLALE